MGETKILIHWGWRIWMIWSSDTHASNTYQTQTHVWDNMGHWHTDTDTDTTGNGDNCTLNALNHKHKSLYAEVSDQLHPKEIVESHTCKASLLSLLIATTTGFPFPSAGWIEPLNTLPNPPSPILKSLLKSLVARLSSEREKTLKFWPFSSYSSGIPRGEADELEDLVTLSAPEKSSCSFSFSSGADLCLPFLDLSLK